MITLATLPQATAQEVFDQVVTHLLTQGKQCSNGDVCQYRNREGLKCAAGCLIAENEYSVDLEGKTWAANISRGKVPNYHEQLISNLQRAHDQKRKNFWTIKDDLKEIADSYNLSTTVLDSHG